MKIPFPEHLVKDLKFIFAQNRNLLPPSLRLDEKNTFLHYKIWEKNYKNKIFFFFRMSDEENKLQDVENEIPEEENVAVEDSTNQNQAEENFTTLHMVDVPNLVKNMGLQQR